MSRSAASGWIGRLSLKPSRCVCWGVGSKDQYSKVLTLIATLDVKAVYADVDFVVIAAPTNVYSTNRIDVASPKRTYFAHSIQCNDVA